MVNLKIKITMTQQEIEKEMIQGIFIREEHRRVIKHCASVAAKLIEKEKRKGLGFAEWCAMSGWRFGGRGLPKHAGYWIQFKGRGAGYKKESSSSLYELYNEYLKSLTNK